MSAIGSAADTRRSRLLARDVLHLGTTGLRARPTRAILSALGIAIGIAAMIAVVGISSSSQAKLNEQLAQLGTNLLTIQAGKSLFGQDAALPESTVGKVGLVEGVEQVGGAAALSGLSVYRSSFIDPAQSGGLGVSAVSEGLLDVVGGTLAAGEWLNAATARYPTVVLGSKAAERLGIDSIGSVIWLGDAQFTVVGILDPVALAPELDTTAMIGEQIAAERFAFDGKPTTVYERSTEESVAEVRALLPRTVNP